MITKAFENRIFREVFVDTRKYRYCSRERVPGRIEIIRLPISDLGTSAAYDEWEIVKTIMREEYGD